MRVLYLMYWLRNYPQDRSTRPGPTDQKSGAPIPNRADVCLVPAKISPLGGALGAYCRLLRGVSDNRHHPHVDSEMNRRIDSRVYAGT